MAVWQMNKIGSHRHNGNLSALHAAVAVPAFESRAFEESAEDPLLTASAWAWESPDCFLPAYERWLPHVQQRQQ